MVQNSATGTSLEIQRIIEDTIKRFVLESPKNSLTDIDGSPIFEEPLVGFADGDDALFLEYKSIIGDFHMTPREALERHVEGVDSLQFPRVGVVSWILPIAEKIRLNNREMEGMACLRWNRARWQGEALNEALRQHLIALVQEKGYHAVIPPLTPSFKQVQLDNGPASSWSERHIAYAAGLGTFSLTDALITAKGTAMRCGSVVTSVSFVPSPRSYTSHQAYCPFVRDGTCGLCIQRCPANAIDENGHDKKRCREYNEVELKAWAAQHPEAGYIGRYPACGLCLTGVPCEAQIP
ncbi:MAG: epoxyqueuosine reductase [Chloroflexi bacterium]|nr:epoxyqueuosine reductase [Chloroflexota bacterium]